MLRAAGTGGGNSRVGREHFMALPTAASTTSPPARTTGALVALGCSRAWKTLRTRDFMPPVAAMRGAGKEADATRTISSSEGPPPCASLNLCPGVMSPLRYDESTSGRQAMLLGNGVREYQPRWTVPLCLLVVFGPSCGVSTPPPPRCSRCERTERSGNSASQ